MSYKLPDKFRDKVSAFPEVSYGVSRVTLVLDDGKRIPHVRVAWGGEIIDDKDIGPGELERLVDVEPEP